MCLWQWLKKIVDIPSVIMPFKNYYYYYYYRKRLSVGKLIRPRSHGGRICELILAAAAHHRLITVTRAEQQLSDSRLHERLQDNPRIIDTPAKQNAENWSGQTVNASSRLLLIWKELLLWFCSIMFSRCFSIIIAPRGRVRLFRSFCWIRGRRDRKIGIIRCVRRRVTGA